MSGFAGADAEGSSFAFAGITPAIGTPLSNLLLCDAIVPGSPAGYQLCKAIYSYHPLGAKMAEAPINMAQSQRRKITIPAGPEEPLLDAFWREWRAIGGIGADALIHNTMRTSRIYGISSVVCGERSKPTNTPLPLDKLHEMDLYFNVLDPLNTAGSLVLNQDPNSPDFQKPREVRVGNQVYHPSRSLTVMNEQPIYIEWTSSAYGFVGRSVYQRALFPMKTFLQSMITDDMVTKKVGLLVWMAKAAGSIVNNRMMKFFGWKREQLKGGLTGNVLTIDAEEKIESINLQNLEGPARFARENVLKNIATAAGMPAKLLEQEAMVEGFGEGAEDAKQIARYIDRVRLEMGPLYSYFDQIVQRRAWSPEFYETIRKEYPEYRRKPYETAFYEWSNSFTATWPNLLEEPDSEKAKMEDVRLKSVLAVVQVLLPELDPDNKAAAIDWLVGNINANDLLFTDELIIDEIALAKYLTQQKDQADASAEASMQALSEPAPPKPFAAAA